jgi:hypothetical protein
VRATFPKVLAVLATVLCLGALPGCSGDDEPTPEASSSPSTGSPFSATIEGPDVAAPGDTVKATLTNTGRLPDKYRFVPNPEGGATVTPAEVSLAPDQSVDVTIELSTSPLVIEVESIGAGGPGFPLAELSIGSQ